MTTPDSSPAPPPPPPYLSSFGPEDGPIPASLGNPVMGVLLERGGFPAGTAWPAGSLRGKQLYRLCLRAAGELKGPEVELDGRWVCVRRVFERVGDAALG